jgi:hypothetical protein
VADAGAGAVQMALPSQGYAAMRRVRQRGVAILLCSVVVRLRGVAARLRGTLCSWACNGIDNSSDIHCMLCGCVASRCSFAVLCESSPTES